MSPDADSRKRRIPVSPSLPEIWSSARGDLTRSWLAVVEFVALWKTLSTAALAPLAVWTLSLLLQRTGHAAVSNDEIVEFLFTPTGVCYAALFASMLFGSLLIESAGVVAVAAWQRAAGARLDWNAAAAILYRASLIVRLAIVQGAAATLLAGPLALVLAGLYVLLLSQFDVNYYLTNQPPAFYVAASAAVASALAFTAAGVWLAVRWSFAAPLLLFEEHHIYSAMRRSWRMTRGSANRLAATLLTWHVLVFASGAAVVAVFRFAADHLLAETGERLATVLPLAAALLVVQTLLVLTPSAIAVVGHSLIVFAYYCAHRPPPEPDDVLRTTPPRMLVLRRWSAIAVAGLGFAAAIVVAGWQLRVDWRQVEITSHRGHGNHSPENTLAAIREAIAAHADYVEIDVQATRDGVVVLAHDRDMKRTAGSPLRVTEATLEELQRLDLGRGFGDRFTGERIATLDEVIDLCRGQIRVNIELKVYGGSLDLAQRVVDQLAARDFASECVVTSLNLPISLEVERLAPRLETGLIVGYAFGDVSRLQVDFLSIRADLATSGLIKRAHQAGKKIHAWTVNSSPLASRLMAAGVDNLITDEPAILVPLRNEWERLSDVEQLLLAARFTLDFRR